jgi:hypothetical protein
VDPAEGPGSSSSRGCPPPRVMSIQLANLGANGSIADVPRPSQAGSDDDASHRQIACRSAVAVSGLKGTDVCPVSWGWLCVGKTCEDADQSWLPASSEP